MSARCERFTLKLAYLFFQSFFITPDGSTKTREKKQSSKNEKYTQLQKKN